MYSGGRLSVSAIVRLERLNGCLMLCGLTIVVRQHVGGISATVFRPAKSLSSGLFCGD